MALQTDQESQGHIEVKVRVTPQLIYSVVSPFSFAFDINSPFFVSYSYQEHSLILYTKISRLYFFTIYLIYISCISHLNSTGQVTKATQAANKEMESM